MRDTEFWGRMERALGPDYARSWASLYVIADLRGRTAQDALDSGVPAKEVWRAVWAVLGLPAKER